MKTKEEAINAIKFYYVMREAVLNKYSDHRFKVPVNQALEKILEKKPADISNWKKGRRGINHIEDFAKLAEAFDTKIDVLYRVSRGLEDDKLQDVLKKYAVAIEKAVKGLK